MPLVYTWTLSTPTPAAPLPYVSPALDTGAQNVKRDLLLDNSTGDLVMVGGDFVFSTGAQSIAQDIWLALGFFQGEWFLDEEAGFPWRELVFVKNPDLERIRAGWRDKILSRRGVNELLELKQDFNRAIRFLSVSWRVNTDVGELSSARALIVGA
jgi:hypothetical protein